MNKKVLFFVLVVFAMILASCGGAATPAPAGNDAPAATSAPADTGVPAVCGTDEFGCAVIPAGSTVKLGMGAPMTGDYASFGIDISQGATIAVKDGGELDGFQI